MPSSTSVGSRFISRMMCAYSSSERPCSLTRAGVMAVTSVMTRARECCEGRILHVGGQRVVTQIGMLLHVEFGYSPHLFRLKLRSGAYLMVFDKRPKSTHGVFLTDG